MIGVLWVRPGKNRLLRTIFLDIGRNVPYITTTARTRANAKRVPKRSPSTKPASMPEQTIENLESSLDTRNAVAELNRLAADAAVLRNQIDTTDERFHGHATYDVKHLDERREEIARQIALGRTNVQIAENLGCTPQTVSNIRNNPIIAAVIDTFRGQRNAKVSKIVDEIIDVAPTAIRLLRNTLTLEQNKDDETGASMAAVPTLSEQIAASRTILGFVPTGDRDGGQNGVDETQLARIKQRAVAIRSDYNAFAEDAQFVDVATVNTTPANGDPTKTENTDES